MDLFVLAAVGPRVYNKHHGNVPADAVYVGRPSKWGNKNVIGPTCTRQQAVALHRASITPEFRKQIIKELRGKDLVCSCAPAACHGYTLLEIANSPDNTMTESSRTRSSSSRRSSSSSRSSRDATDKSSELKTESLAVTYRPKILDDLVGQDHLVAAIDGMFTKRKLPSAIMLHGPTGLGKTTIARILARYINCTNRDTKTHAPCGECANCTMENHPDVLELNAADTRGIDDVRKLIEQARNMPTLGTKRLFIIDEAQQLTPQAQQAILRPIEEPPKGTLWIICTMSPDKVLPAIAGRCTKLQVKMIEPSVMISRLMSIAKQEGVDFKKVDPDGKVIKSIADFSGGHMRNAVELLERVLFALSSKRSKVDPKEVLSTFLSSGEGELESAAAHTLVSVLQKDLKEFLVATNGCDNVRGLLNKLRWLIDYLVSNVVGRAKFTPYSGRLFSKIAKERSLRVSLSTLIRFQSVLVDVEARLNSMSVDERIVFTSMVGNFIVELAS